MLVLGAGCRCWCWCCELAARVVETGCWRRVGGGAGASAELAVHVVETGCWCWCRVPVLVLGWCCELAVDVVETGCWCWCRVPVLVLVLLAGCARGGDRLLVLVV